MGPRRKSWTLSTEMREAPARRVKMTSPAEIKLIYRASWANAWDARSWAPHRENHVGFTDPWYRNHVGYGENAWAQQCVGPHRAHVNSESAWVPEENRVGPMRNRVGPRGNRGPRRKLVGPARRGPHHLPGKSVGRDAIVLPVIYRNTWAMTACIVGPHRSRGPHQEIAWATEIT